MREVIVGILSTEEMESQTKFSETENVYKAEFPSMYQNMGELIRCKYCKYFNGDNKWCDCDHNVTSIDYCSSAKRREE